MVGPDRVTVDGEKYVRGDLVDELVEAAVESRKVLVELEEHADKLKGLALAQFHIDIALKKLEW